MSGTLHFRREATELLSELVIMLNESDEFDDLPDDLQKKMIELVNTVMTCIFDNGYENGRLDVRDE